MKRNIRFLTLGLVFSFCCPSLMAQSVGEMESSQTTVLSDSVSELPISWQVGLDLSSITASMLGGGASEHYHFGIQAKRLKGTNGVRFNAQFFPVNYGAYPNNHFDRNVGSVGGNTLFVTHESHTNSFRVGSGLQWGKTNVLGRTYIGGDLWLNYDNTQVYAWQYVEDPTDDYSNRYDDFPIYNGAKFHGYGIGVSPLVGFESGLWKGFGVSLEGKFDLAVVGSESYSVDNSAQLSRGGNIYTFRTFPLLDFRLFYRF